MELSLSDNIRTFRKQRRMTQEQLAEVLGVTVGAVHKWESGLSVPELAMIVEMADFFDVSVDVLLGYRMKDNSHESVSGRLLSLCRTMDPSALQEADKALGKYPNSFEIVHGCAGVYLVFGCGRHDGNLLRKAVELLERSRVLLPQNRDPRVCDATICGDISIAHFLMGENEKALELLKDNNAGGLYDSHIGMLLSAYMNRPAEAVPFLSEGLLNGVSDILTVIVGYVLVFRSRGDWASALAMTEWGIGILNGLRDETRPDYLEKTHAQMLVLLAYAQGRAGMKEESLQSLRQARSHALKFDSDPDYSLQAMRFADNMNETLVFDVFGVSASGSIAALLEVLGDDALAAKWKEMEEDGE
ncbi:MAG: helix-turn-helix transcriptional regulator [Spirochaetales bacterium]|nr:helix-turn-helix transcriptional regulator [Spirochaetales bacterium]